MRRTRSRVRGWVLGAVMMVVAASEVGAATPPALIHYQGTLRDSGNAPLSGAFSMTFAFYSAATGGDEILLDAHNGNAGAPLVTVTGGLFAVAVGSGQVTDGAGPGTVVSVADVFRFYSDVWLELRIGLETLSPRTQMLASAYAENAYTLEGRLASEFLDTSSVAQTKSGRLTLDDANVFPGYGLNISTAGTAGVFAQHKTASGQGYLAYGDYGVWGAGNAAGGYFQSRTGTGSVLLGYGNAGLQGDGSVAGGHFTQSNGRGEAWLGQNGTGGSFYSNGTGYAGLASGDFGIVASGTWPNGAGGSFSDPYYTGGAVLGIGNSGIVSWGNYQGGEFYDTDNAGHARLGFGAIGVYGVGDNTQNFQTGGGGYFEDASGVGDARVASGGTGIVAFGYSYGGQFSNAYGASVNLTSYDTGISAYGPTTGGHYDNSFGVYANLAYWNGSSAYTIQGNGAKSFVQNHPYDPDKSVVFVALEGDEAGTYTRGQGRLANGVAHVRLSPSFALVTNPDLGLTATLSPRGGAAVPLAIESLGSDELVVRGPVGSDGVVFDYTVFGLRLGFEAMPIVQKKADDAPLPTIAAVPLDAAHPGNDNAFARFVSMREETGETAPLDLTRGRALRQAIGIAKEGKPEHPTPADPARPRPTPPRQRPDAATAVVPFSPAEAAMGGGPIPTAAPSITQASPVTAAPAAAESGGMARPYPPGTTPVAVAAEVHGGDVVAITPANGDLRAAVAHRDDPAPAFGIVAGAAGAVWAARAPLALAGSVTLCRVEAESASIAAGDLLTPSAVDGHARRATSGESGPIVAKALEALPGGRGLIRVLVVAR